MIKIAVLLAEGFEETEMTVPVDLLRRAGGEVVLTAIGDTLSVTGAHGMCIQADTTLKRLDRTDLQCVLLPGGGHGTKLLRESTDVRELVLYAVENGLYIAAICAASSVLGILGLLDGRRYACYPGFESFMPDGIHTGKPVEHDDIFLTAEGMGVSFPFGFKLVELLFGSAKAIELREQTRYV